MIKSYFPGMGQAVADRTINRPGENWGDVAERVALGNASLHPSVNDFPTLFHHIGQGSLLMSGRHLQHGDKDQSKRPQEVFTNCSTAMLRSLTFKLLLSGSGVGGCYDDALSLVDWSRMPTIVVTIDHGHPDVLSGLIKNNITVRDALHLYSDSETIVHVVDDSREGWAKAIEVMEIMAYRQEYDKVLILEFSKVRGFGSPIKGMQNRPASGPGPLMGAILNVARLRGTKMLPWRQAMYADHFLAECVLVGGARRAARIAVKYWKDLSIFDFIDIKRPVEFQNRTMDEVINLREDGGYFSSFLWSSNNSVAVDQEFWDQVELDKATGGNSHATCVWNAVMEAQYGDGTGEPGFLNVHKLPANNKGLEFYRKQCFAGSDTYQMDEASLPLTFALTEAVLDHSYQYIVNPCGEITLFILGGFCVIADVVPYHAQNDADAEEAFRVATRALIRVNTMDSIYRKEVQRTNRIGVGMTGIHEYMWDRFHLGFLDVIEEGVNEITPGLREPSAKALPFWNMIKRFAEAVDNEAIEYSAELGVNVPHTTRTIKPAGTTSKLFGLTEGGHLASKRKILRWVQFRTTDPLVEEYFNKGYPIRELKTYSGTTIVGFPTAPVITTLGMGDKLITAGEATPEQQFRWLRLLEHYWIGEETGNQISYTLKYKPDLVTYEQFEETMFKNVPNVRAVSVLPQIDTLSYEYQPEESITDEMFEFYMDSITAAEREDIGFEHVDCAGGSCPIDFRSEAA